LRKPRREARRANEIAEQDRDRAALGVGTCADPDMALRRDRVQSFGAGGGRGVELLNRRSDFEAMAPRTSGIQPERRPEEQAGIGRPQIFRFASLLKIRKRATLFG